MKMEVIAVAPTDLLTGAKKGTFVSWGLLTIHSYSYAVQRPQDIGGLWGWQPLFELADVDTFWGYIRDDLHARLKPANKRRSAMDIYEGAEGLLQLQERQLLLWSVKPKRRAAMLR